MGGEWYLSRARWKRAQSRVVRTPWLTLASDHGEMAASMKCPIARHLMLGAAFCLVPVQVQAEPSAQDKALASVLFKEARDLLANNDIDKACRKFEESQRIDPSGGTLLNLAVCREKQGRTASAWAEFNEALAWARRDGRQDRVQFAHDRMKALEPRLSYIVLDVPPTAIVEGFEVRRDNSIVRRAAFGSRMPVDPGNHVIKALAPGYHPWRAEVSIDRDGSEQRVFVPSLVLIPPSSPAEARTTPEDRTKSPVLWPAYILTGAGVVGLGAGSYFGWKAFSRNSDADDQCPEGRCSEDGLRLTEEAGLAADTSTLMFAAGALCLGAGVTWWFVSSDDDPEASAVSPAIGPEQAGVSWFGRF